MDDFNPEWLTMDLSAPLQGAPPPPPHSGSGPTPLTGFDPLSLSTPPAGGPTQGDPEAAAAPLSAARTTLKLDETRLLQADALPYLRSVCKNMKFSKARGAEVANLDKLVHFYKVWAHRVFPRYPYDRFVERTMRVCRTKRVKAQLSRWIREDLQSSGTYDVDPDAAGLGDLEGKDGEHDQGGEAQSGSQVQQDEEERQQHEDRMNVDDPPALPLPTPSAAGPTTATTEAASLNPTSSAKQRALDRLAQLKQSRFRRSMPPASLPSMVPPSDPLAPSSPASTVTQSDQHRFLTRSSFSAISSSSSSSSSVRRVVAGNDSDDDEGLIVVPTSATSAPQNRAVDLMHDVDQEPSASQIAGLRVFADMAEDDEDDEDDGPVAALPTPPDQLASSKTDQRLDQEDKQSKGKEKRVAELGLSAHDLDGVDMDALFSLDDEQW